MDEIPQRFRQAIAGDFFLFYDSRDDDEYNKSDGRILIFGTRQHLKTLFKSEIWFVDGSLSFVPALFF